MLTNTVNPTPLDLAAQVGPTIRRDIFVQAQTTTKTLRLSDPAAGTAIYFESEDGQTAPVSGAATGRIRYNNTGAGAFEVSVQGGAYASLVTPATAFVQGGNSFGTEAVLGTNDGNNLAFEANGTTWMKILSTGEVVVSDTADFVRVDTGVQFQVVSDGTGSGGGPAFVTAWGANALAGGQAVFAGIRSRGTPAAPAAVQVGDALMAVVAVGYNTTPALADPSVELRFDTDGAPGATYVSGSFSIWTMTSAGPATAERMVVRGDGYVGFGGASGALATEMFRVTGGEVLINHTSTVAFQVYPTGGGGTTFDVDTSNNRVGVNTNNPAFSLDVVGTGRASTYFITPIVHGGTADGASLTLSANTSAVDGPIYFQNHGGTTDAVLLATGQFIVGAAAAVGGEMLRVVGAARVEGKLTVTGGVDPTYMSLSDPLAGTDLYYESSPGQTAATAASGKARIRYNNTTPPGAWEVSVSTGAYTALVTAAAMPGYLANYFYLPGTAGGQSAIGGTGAGDPLTFTATSNATAGPTIFNSKTATESMRILATNQLCIGSATASSANERLYILGNGVSAPNIVVVNAAQAGITVQSSITNSLTYLILYDHDKANYLVLGQYSDDGTLGTLSYLSSTNTAGLRIQTVNAASIQFYTANASRGYISSTGDIIWNSSGTGLAVGPSASVSTTTIANFRRDQNDLTALVVVNSTNDSAAYTSIGAVCDGVGVNIGGTATSFTPSGYKLAHNSFVVGSGTLFLIGSIADVPIEFWTGATTTKRISILHSASNIIQGNGGMVVQGGAGNANALTLSATAGTAGPINFCVTGTTVVAYLSAATEFVPQTTGTGYVGTSSLKWLEVNAITVNTGDINLRDEGGRVLWTIREAEDRVEFINRTTGRRYRAVLEEIAA